MTTHLILIRHGETDWNTEGRFQGHSDTPLNREGVLQAHRLAKRLRHETVDLIYSSPLRRALKTAQIVAGRLKIPVHTDWRLRELNLGRWEGLLAEEIDAAYPDIFQRWYTAPWTVTPPGGESLDQLTERVHAAVDEIASRHRGQHIGLVAHKLSLLTLKIHYQKIDPSLIRTIHLPNTHFEKIAFTPPAL